MGNLNDVVFYLTLTAEIEKGGGSAVIDMEERFCSVSLDIIGLAVFNYDFGSTTRESPIIKAVYTCLHTVHHRYTGHTSQGAPNSPPLRTSILWHSTVVLRPR